MIINHEKCDSGFELKYLGWILNSKKLQISCPPKKAAEITSLVHAASSRRGMPARELASVVGKLTWLSFGSPQGCTFLSSLWRVVARARGAWGMTLKITKAAHKDLLWWAGNMKRITAFGRNLALHPDIWHSFELNMYADASGYACGGHVAEFWYVHVFTDTQKLWDIHHKEAFASFLLLILANKVLLLAGRKIRMWSDNQALVECMKPTRGVSRDPLLMDILR